MKQLIINNLCVEITRRCNLCCNHCMRGDSQNINLSDNELKQLFYNDKFDIKQICSLVITGGEPTLNIKSIIKIIKVIMDKKIKLDAFTMVINGSNYNQDMIDSLNILYNYWLNNEYRKQFELICSMDQFHKEPKKEVLEKYLKCPYFISNKVIMDNSQIIRIGRARKNNLGSIDSYQLNRLYFDLYSHNNKAFMYTSEEGNLCLEELYLSAPGKYGYHIMDATYEMIDKLCTLNFNDLVCDLFENEQEHKSKIYLRKRNIIEK